MNYEKKSKQKQDFVHVFRKKKKKHQEKVKKKVGTNHLVQKTRKQSCNQKEMKEKTMG